MSKRTKKINQKCDDYIFYLKPQQNYCKFPQTISVSFCDSSKHKRLKKTTESRQIKCKDCPVFNKDDNYATPTFILNSEKQHFQEQGQRMRTQHQKKMIEYTDQKDSLNLPKPRSKNSFCNVCRQVYEDYLNHIQSQSHKKCIHNSSFNRSILQLVEKVNPSQKSSINFSQNTLSTQDDDDVEILFCKPKKKIKTIEQNTDKTNQPAANSQILPPPHLNLSHATYFPNSYQGFIPNQGYNFMYPYNNFPSVDTNFNNQQFVPNPSNYPYQMQNYNIMNAWPDYMAPYQRNLLSFQPINQFNPVMQQNVSPFTGFLNGLANFNQNNLQQRPTQLAVDKIKERKDLDEERKMLIKIIESQKQNQLNMFQKPER